AGLNRINVSLGTLKPDIYKKIYGSDSLNIVLEGLMIAKEVGLTPLKLNYVVLKGINDQEIKDIVNFCAENEFILQLIELHKTSQSVRQANGFYEKYYFDIKPIIEDFEKRATNIEVRGNMQNRKVFTLPNSVKIETISPGHEFCMGCTKLRVGCDGNLFGCLFRSDLGTNIKEALQNNHSLSMYEKIVKQVVDTREPYY
ncbi:MAG: radical SAM protein, partial [Promethearchaeota archaeon]